MTHQDRPEAPDRDRSATRDDAAQADVLEDDAFVDDAFEDLLNRSSLGTPGAVKLRRRADAAGVARVQRAASRPNRTRPNRTRPVDQPADERAAEPGRPWPTACGGVPR